MAFMVELETRKERVIMKQRWRIFSFLVSALGLSIGAPVWGKDCGGEVVCECGDTVVADYKLPADLGPCSGGPGSALSISDSVNFDGQGYKIFGNDFPHSNENFGVSFRGQGSSVKNVKVSKFARCVRFRGNDALARPASDNVIKSSEMSECGFFIFTGTPPQPTRKATSSSYGVDFAQGAVGNTVKDNWIYGAFDEGVHFGSGSADNALVNNFIENSGNEQVYILNTSGTIVKENVIMGGRVSVFVDGANANTVKGNWGDRLLQVRASAADNEFHENTFRSIRFEMNATNNLVKEGQIIGGNPCIQLRTGASGNVLRDVELVDCVNDIDARETGTNTLINVAPLHPDRISVQAQAVVIVCNEGGECQEFTAP